MRTMWSRRSGLTLVELIVAFTLLLILSSMALPLAGIKVQREKERLLRDRLEEIRKAIEDRYPDIEVKEVRTMVVRGKRRRQMTKKGLVQGRQAGWKKAIVTLKAGEIDFYESV